MRLPHTLLGLSATIVACGGVSVAEGHESAIGSRDDRCPALPAACLEGFDPYRDEDGCPDPPLPLLELPPGPIPSSTRRTIDDVATASRRLMAGSHLIIVTAAAPGDSDPATRRLTLVREALLAREVRASLIEHVLIQSGAIDDPRAARILIAVEGCTFDDGIPDSDADRIADYRDACPDDAEDIDGYRDDDGCPDFDHSCEPVDPDADPDCDDADSDGVLTPADRCPERPGPTSGAGCPQPRFLERR